jgi:tripeptidyl-peptidase-1
MGALSQSFNPDDLEMFQQLYGLQSQAMSKIVGPNNPDSCSVLNNCFEANLDTQYIRSIAQDAPTWFWSIPHDPFSSPFLRYVAALNADPNPPDVHSISYANAEKLMDPIEVKVFNDEACKLALRGITLITAAGDFGAPGIEGCLTSSKKCTINPLFPASCPYVTSVGSTMGPETGDDEVASSLDRLSSITTGGGFSTIFSRPPWQKKAVLRYLNNYNSVPISLFASQGRAYPDISFLGNNYEFVINGEIWLISGTSASAPAFASLITLANSLRIANGKPKLGFLNPLIYNKILANSITDITEGNNRCCTFNENFCCPNGWDASRGWDPVTGLGVLDFKEFIDVISDMQSSDMQSSDQDK